MLLIIMVLSFTIFFVINVTYNHSQYVSKTIGVEEYHIRHPTTLIEHKMLNLDYTNLLLCMSRPTKLWIRNIRLFLPLTRLYFCDITMYVYFEQSRKN